MHRKSYFEKLSFTKSFDLFFQNFSHFSGGYDHAKPTLQLLSAICELSLIYHLVSMFFFFYTSIKLWA